jgi:hypothetical protein
VPGVATPVKRCCSIAVVCAFAATNAQASTELGETFTPTGVCGPGSTAFQVKSPDDRYRAQQAGVITGWSHQGASEPRPGAVAQLKVGRPRGSELRAVGESASEPVNSGALNSFLTRVPLRAGDVIGLSTDDGACARLASPGTYESAYTEFGVGPPYLAGGETGQAQINVSAVLEPDVDLDCLGDETQDAVVVEHLEPLPDCDLDPPQTKWIHKPPRRTAKQEFSVQYRSTDPDSIFECRLDKAYWYVCGVGGEIIEEDRGVHLLQIRAVDEAANADLTQIHAGFRVGSRHRAWDRA